MRELPKLVSSKKRKTSDDVNTSTTEIFWFRAKNEEKNTPQVKLILAYVERNVRTIKGEASCLFDAANSLHPVLQFIIEKNNSEGKLSFLHLNINVSQGRGVTCNWHRKATDTGTLLNYRSCTLTQALYKALYTEFLGVHLLVSSLIRLWKLIGRSG